MLGPGNEAVRISATIIALNEERNIARAIQSAGFCDETVVVDSGSSDQTVPIAESLGATVLTNEWPGFAAQKNFAAKSASHDWILSLDADEAVSEGLASEIVNLREEPTEFAGFDFPRLARYCGRWIRHSGWYPDRKVRLYHRDSGRWSGPYVHESVQLEGPVGHLEGDLLHYTCDNLDHHRQNIDRYTDLAARELRDSGKSTPAWRLLLGPSYSFVKSYALQCGFLDGRQGLTIARMAAWYVYLKYRKARTLAAE